MKSPRKRPDSHRRERNPACWCGNRDLKRFSDDYLRCARCETLVLRHMPTKDVTRVRDDSVDLYGRNYYLKHLQQDFGYPDLKTRARTDLPERCLHWLRTTLKYKIPPGKALELGSAHGAFVALLRWAGFDAKGLELSPWVVNFARGVFKVPMLSGPIEDQRLAPRSLDVIALMDVLEHLPSPLATMKRCLRLLKKDGVLVIQTPRYPEAGRHKEMITRRDPFLEQLKSSDHLYLYSQKSVQEFLRRLGITYVAFEPAIFAHYDMFLVASPAPLSITSPEQLETILSATPSSRLIQALLDTDDRSHNLQERLGVADTDRAARLEVIQQQGRRTAELEAEVHRWLEETKKYAAQAQQSESLRAGLNEQASRLIEENQQATTRMTGLQAELKQERRKSEAFAKEKLDLLGQLDKVRLDLAAVEADRAARLEVIQQQGQRATELEAEVHRWLEEAKKYSAQAQQSESLRAGLNEQASRLIEENQQAIARMTGLQAELKQERGKSEAFAKEKLDLLGQLDKVRLDLAAAEANRAQMSVDLAASADHLARLRAELEQERSKGAALAREKQAQQAAFAKEKLDLLGQLDKVRRDLAAAEADRTQLSADLATSAGHLTRLQAESERQKNTNASLTRDLHAAKEESRILTARLDAQSRALDGTLKSLEAARARIGELQEQLSRIEEHALVRALKTLRLRPW